MMIDYGVCGLINKYVYELCYRCLCTLLENYCDGTGWRW